MNPEIDHPLVDAALARLNGLPNRDDRHRWLNALAQYVGYAELAALDRQHRAKTRELEDVLRVFVDNGG